MPSSIRSDLVRLLPASVVILVYGWFATDLSTLSTALTLGLAWVGFVVAGLAGLRLLRRYDLPSP